MKKAKIAPVCVASFALLLAMALAGCAGNAGSSASSASSSAASGSAASESAASGAAASESAASSEAESASAASSTAASESAESASSASEASSSASSPEGTAGSNIPIKDNPEEAKHQIEIAMQDQLEKAFGDKIDDARIYVEKVYSDEEEKADELLKSYGLSPDEVAFEVKYELHPVEGTDVNALTAGTGRYDESTGWVVEKYNVGILRPNADGDPAYVITDFGTGF